MFGILLFIYDILRIEPAFLPILTVSTVTLLTYLGGMLGGLKPSVILILAAGICALFYELFRIIKKKLSLAPILKAPAIWFFAVLCIYFVIQMRGMLVLHVDNFSHWATVIKEMCTTDSFPVTGSAVTFRNYTPGSAVFIYFICNTVGFTEGSALMAQGFIIAASLAVIFCKSSFKDPVTLISLVLASIISVSIPELLSASLHYYNFLVDGLIAYVTVAAGIIAYYYRNDLRRCLTVLIPVTAMLTIIKTSARFFALMIAVMVFILFARKIFSANALRRRATYFSLGGIAGLVAAQLISPSLWNIYISNAFTDVTLSDNKFPSTANGLISSLISKDGDYLRDIASKMYAELTDLTDPVITLLLVAETFAVCVLVITLVLKERPGVILPVFVFANLTYVFYIIELFVLYGFIFPESEATILASFYRYLSTGVAITVTVLLVGGIYRISRLSKKAIRITASLTVTVATVFCLCIIGDNAVQMIDPVFRDDTAVRTEERAKYADIYRDIQSLVPAGSSVIVYTSDTSFFAACLPGYELSTASYSMMRPADLLADPEYARKRIEGVEYVVVTDTVNEFYESTEAMNITVTGSTPAEVYKVSADGGNVTLTPIYE